MSAQGTCPRCGGWLDSDGHCLIPGCGPADVCPNCLREVCGCPSLEAVPYGAYPNEQADTPTARADDGQDDERPGQDAGGSLAERLRGYLLDAAGLDTIAEPAPLVKNVTYADSLVWVQGRSGEGKSFVALDMAGCIGTGEAWQTHPTTPGAVVYVIAEGAAGIRARVRAWEQAYGRLMSAVWFLPVAVQSGVDAQWSALVQLCAELRPALVVIDTQARVTVGMEENSARDMGLFVERLERLRRSCGACVMVLHHMGRSGDNLRGSSALEGAAATVVKVSKDDDVVTVTNLKQKDAPEFDDIRLRMVPTAGSVTLALTDAAPGTGRLSGSALKTARTWWAHHADSWAGRTALVDIVATRSVFYRNLRALESLGMVECDRAGRYPKYRLTRDPDTRTEG